MAARIITQLIMSGSQILFKAFGEAYRKGVQNATGGAATQAAARSSATATMNVEQARMILELPRTHTKEELLKRYTYLAKQNEPPAGSAYIFAKIENAKQILEEAAKAEAKTGGASSGAGAGAGAK
eukprot:Amastigsp_a677179_316.p1 type:complete len:126 gc:universal Amastigsp_a677179_316:108-485(+)